MNYKEEVFEFLKSKESIKKFKRDNYNYIVVKIPFNSTIDLVYADNTYREGIGFDAKIEYQGFYDKGKEELCDIGYDIYNILGIELGNKDYITMSDLLKDFNNKVNEIITNYVLENKKEFYDSANSYESNLEKENIYGNIISGIESFEYLSIYDSNNKTNVLKYLDQGEEFLYEIASNYIEKQRENIEKNLKDIDKSNKLLEEINNDLSDKIHKRKDILDSLKDTDYKRVSLFICKDGKLMNFKIDVSAIEYSWNSSYISQYSMSVKDRDDFEDLFGRREDFNMEDIYKIEYRNKPIYVDAELEKKIDDNGLELSIN